MTSERLEQLRANRDAVRDELRRRAARPAITPDPGRRYEPFPLTDVQSAYLLGRRSVFAYGGVACHGYIELDIGDVEPARLEAAWQAVIRRHDMLRAVVEAGGRQRVLPEAPAAPIRVVDVRGRAEAEVTAAVAASRADMSHRVYPTSEWPLFELRLTRADAGSRLHVSFDLLVADFVSFQLLLDELRRRYDQPDERLPSLELTFRDYVLAERELRTGPAYDRDRSYWLGRLDHLPGPPELPVAEDARSAPARFDRHRLRLAPGAWSALKRRAGARQVTPSTALLAAYTEVLARWSRQPRFTLNLTLLNRQPLHPDVDALVGDFTSVELLAVTRDQGRPLAERAAALQAQLWEDLDHRRFSGIDVMRELARRRAGGDVLFPVVFTSAVGVGGPSGEEPAWAFADADYGITQTPQVWLDCQAVEQRGAVSINWDVRANVFPPGVAGDMFCSFEDLLTKMAAGDEAWDDADPVRLPGEHLARRRAVNTTDTPLPGGLLHDGLVEQAARDGRRVAVITPAGPMSYGELLGRACDVARALRERGCAPGDLVAVVMDKGVEQIVGVLGTLLSGAAYLPIDTNQPPARRETILRDAGARYLLTQSWVKASSPAVATIVVDDLPAAASACAKVATDPADLAYVMYTSGSTGTPKGVMVTHRSARNTIEDINARFRVHPADVVLGLASLGFDLSVYDIFGVLGAGGTLVLPDPSRRGDPSHWAELVAAHRVTLWNSVPAQLQMLYDYVAAAGGPDLGCLRLVMVSGDWIPVTLPGQVRALVPGVEFFSLGGATEAAIWSIIYPVTEVRPEWRSIPYGKPLANQTFSVLDDAMRPCPDWVAGELYIGGVGLALGYFGDETKTAERFVRHPATGERLYRTGDLGRYLPSGDIEFLGRADFQVKIRGHRIELAEIEAALVTYDAVASAVVVVEGEAPLRHRLVAVVEPAAEAPGPAPSPDTAALLAFLAGRLPDYMLPSRVVVVDHMPLTGNGKVDRRALRALLPGEPEAAADDGEDPADDLERQIAAIWARHLGLPHVSRRRDFFAAGGDSLLAARIAGDLLDGLPPAAAFVFDELLVDLLEAPTVAGLAERIRAGATGDLAGADGPDPVSVLAPIGDGPVWVLVHDGTGTVVGMAALAAALASAGAGVLALSVRDPGAYTAQVPASLLESVAERYVASIARRALPAIHLVTRGTGALLALEVARQLAERAAPVAGLTIVDPLPAAAGAGGDDDVLLARALDLGWQPGDGAGELHAELEPVLAAVPPGLPALPVPDVCDVFRHTRAAIAAYQPSVYAGDVTLVLADGGDEPPAFWRDLILGAVTTRPATGTAALRAPGVAALLRTLTGEGAADRQAVVAPGPSVRERDPARPEVVVCGTRFGRVYLSAFDDPAFGFRLAGILARGSDRSRRCAEQYGVPLYTTVDDIPASVSMACVVVSAAVNGGQGTELAKALMARGIHVLQEHPVHHDELAECVRHARRHGVVYRLNTHYPHVPAVRCFLDAARTLAAKQPLLFVDGACSIQVKYSFFDIVGQALGGLRPWAFTDVAAWCDEVDRRARHRPPFQSLDGVINGVPVTVRLQNQMHPTDPDNHAHVYHRLTIGAQGGSLTLVDSNGPVVWSPRPHIPQEVQDGVAPASSQTRFLDFATATTLGPGPAPTWREVMTSTWPGAVRQALSEWRRTIEGSDGGVAHAQYHLTLTDLVQDVNARYGPPRLLREPAPTPIDASELVDTGQRWARQPS
jgi:pyochelin synthetase